MQARVVTVQIKPGRMDDAISIYRDSVVPAANQLPGSKGLRLLTDATTGKCISISLWETEADMEAGEASGYYQEQIAKFADVFAAPPTMEHYEVSVVE